MLSTGFLVLFVLYSCTGLQLEAGPTITKGVGSPSLRIINGKDATEHAIPSMAFITVRNKEGRTFNCGGSLVHKQFVLTAAHCLSEPGTKVLKVHLGVHKYDRSDANQTFTAAAFEFHSAFKVDTSTAHDVGLIKLATAANIHPGIVEVAKVPSAATFPDKMDIYVDKQPTMYGWGLIKQKPEKTPKVLQTITGKIVAFSKCKYANRARNNTLCMGRLDNYLGIACYGDSGSPLILDGAQIGVVSGGSISPMACHRSEYALFARVDYHRDWIVKTIKKLQ